MTAAGNKGKGRKRTIVRAANPTKLAQETAFKKPEDSKPAMKPANDVREVKIERREGEDPELTLARTTLAPYITNANVAVCFAQGIFGGVLPLDPLVTALTEGAKRVNANDMADVEATLFSQATALNIMFAELSRRSANNMGTNLQTSELYLRMAFKAQNQCRMTLETLSNIKNPPVVYAKQANIANGPQQVNNGSMPRAHAEGNQNQPNKLLEQSNEQRMDNGTQSTAGSGNPPMEAVAAVNRA
jgi:hypothetical protein